MNQQKQEFRTKTGLTFGGLSHTTLLELRRELEREYGLTSAQIVEAASYSMAMVVRFALGLSASGGKVCAIVKDCLAGYVALATIRHLVNAGTQAQVLVAVEDPSTISAELKGHCRPLEKMGVPIPDVGSATEVDQFTQFLSSAHNIIFGVFAPDTPSDPFIAGLSELINEERTPAHCIEAPPGLDPNTGMPMGTPLYASSTLSLGAPLVGLYHGRDYVGRHYLCDISLSASMYLKHGLQLGQAFSDQPVVQIFPVTQESAE